ncbi:hypothetical protein CIPAW_10G063200 [Carya illinoinensis]|uniref:Uncharacterized protein n=1 Tax=Carya illinoinensis TaxID=32201 RepID=A0A8T1P9P4_CARIL|nr:hypothetical protein CIPAW_10G063200 [Carya illinoinensis]
MTVTRNKQEEMQKAQKLTPSFPFFLEEKRSDLVSLFSLRLIKEVFFGVSDATELTSLPLDITGPQGSFLRLRFKTQFLLIILLFDEPFSFISQPRLYMGGQMLQKYIFSCLYGCKVKASGQHSAARPRCYVPVLEY